MRYPRVKICCIQNIDEMQMAERYGASLVGLVGEMPSGFGPISLEKIAEITAATPPGLTPVLLTSAQDTRSIINQLNYTGITTVQIVDSLESGSYEDLRKSIPGVKIIQVLHVKGEETLVQAAEVSSQVDAILLDSGTPNAEIKVLGGTGKTHNWDISRKLCEKVEVPVYLAGGLHPGNVKEAISKVSPFGLDLCTGIRTNGKLDEQKVASFFKSIHNSKGLDKEL